VEVYLTSVFYFVAAEKVCIKLFGVAWELLGNVKGQSEKVKVKRAE
jgi:hypothetical protein